MDAAIDTTGASEQLRVMLVDDDSVREVLSEMLGMKGWVVGAFLNSAILKG